MTGAKADTVRASSDRASRPRRSRKGRSVSLAQAEWPEADRVLWAAAFETRGLFDDQACGAHLTTRSQAAVTWAYGAWLRYVRDHAPAGLALHPAERATSPRLEGFVRHMAETVTPKTVVTMIGQLCMALRLVAPNPDLKGLQRLQRRFAARIEPPDHRARLRGSHELYRLGTRLMDAALDEAAEGPVSTAAALRYRDGLMIALLTVTALRRTNLANLKSGRHLIRTCSGWDIEIPATETKTSAPITFELSADLSSRIDIYLARFRPAICNAKAHAGLWASAKGGPMTDNGVYLIIRKRTAAAFGSPHNPHLFRHEAATMLAIHDPHHVGVAAELLGHADPTTTEQYYIQAQGIQASRMMTEVIARARGRPGLD